MRLSWISVVALTAFVGCGKSKSLPPKPIPGSAHVQGTVHTDEVLAAWRNAGLTTDGFASMDPPPASAAFCEHGFVRGVDTTVCEYVSEDNLSRGMQQVKADWAQLDTHTGVVLRTKRTTMVAVDRERREPSGKTISQMTKVFSKL
jgi:hypothetical protein